MKNMRDYGLGDYGIPDGPPRVLEILTEPIDGNKPFCVSCQCETLVSIEVTLAKITFPGLEGKSGVGTYLSCPACPWASPMVIRVSVTS